MPRPTTPLVLAIDQGTTTTKALLVDVPARRVVAQAGAPVRIAFPAPGWVEQDAADIWDSVRRAVRDALAAVPDAALAAVALSTQRESVVAWHRATGAPVGPVLGWQDARTAARCADLAAGGAAALVRARTGLSLDPMFSAPKMRWLADHARAAGVRGGDLCLGTVDAWLVRQLTGGQVFATDAGNAARTLLLDLRTLAWSPDLLDLFGVPAAGLPEIRPSDGGFGVTAAGSGLPAGVPVAAVLADSHAALFHHGCTRTGLGKATYGTGSSVMTPAPLSDDVPDGIVATVAWATRAGGPTYAREGNIVATGSALDWMARTLGCPPDASGGAFLTALAADAPDGAGGVSFVPAFSGLGAPYWDRAASGVVTGITGGTTRAQLARAALEAVAHQVADVVDAMESDGQASLARLHADGGATASALLMQWQADLLGREVHVADEPEASALGAARLAGDAVGLAPRPGDERLAGRPPVRPATPEGQRQAERARWRVAVARSRGEQAVPAAATAS